VGTPSELRVFCGLNGSQRWRRSLERTCSRRADGDEVRSDGYGAGAGLGVDTSGWTVAAKRLRVGPGFCV